MLTINAADQSVRKRSLREALLELDPKTFGKNWKQRERLLMCGFSN